MNWSRALAFMGVALIFGYLTGYLMIDVLNWGIIPAGLVQVGLGLAYAELTWPHVRNHD